MADLYTHNRCVDLMVKNNQYQFTLGDKFKFKTYHLQFRSVWNKQFQFRNLNLSEF